MEPKKYRLECPRCKGFVIGDYIVTEEGRFRRLRCINCGWMYLVDKPRDIVER